MPPLTVSQLAYLRLMLGTFSASFTDAELNALAVAAYAINLDTYLQGTLSYAFYSLSTAALTFVNFKQGETSESQAVIYDRLSALSKIWRGEAGWAVGLPLVQIIPIRQYAVHLPQDFIVDA